MSRGDVGPYYLAGPTNGTGDRLALARARDALVSRGYRVVAPALDHAPTDDVDELVTAMSADLAALTSAVLLVLLPDSAALWERATAVALGVPVCSLAAALAERVPA